MSESVLLDLGLIIFLGFSAQWIAWQLKVPSILFLLLFGILSGPVLGYIFPDILFGDVLMPFVSISVAIILFEGGLTLKFSELARIGRVVTLLITLGVLVTWVVTAAAAFWLLDLNIHLSVLIGAVLTVTGPTVIGPLLRNIKPQKNVANILKWEGILIDPLGALLTILVFEVIITGEAQEAAVAVVMSVAKTIFFGSLVGTSFAFLLAFIIKKYWIPDYLHGTASLTFVAVAFLISNFLQEESGLLAATVMGIALTNQTFASIKKIKDFKENLTLFIIPVLFILLSGRMTLSNITLLFTGTGLAFLMILIFIGRPLSVFLATRKSDLHLNEKLFISWMAPRGIVAAAVSAVFALKLTELDIPQVEYLVPVTFLAIIGTVTVYGFTSPMVARWLKVSQSDPQGVLIVGAHDWALQIAKALHEKQFTVAVIDTNRDNIMKAKMMGLIGYNESVIADQTVHAVNLEGIGKLIAFTPNDEVNSLSVLHFSEVFEKRNMYQLVPNTNQDEKEFASRHLRGRFLFGKGINYSFVARRFRNGAIVKSTSLTDEFTYDDFLYQNNSDVTLLFVISHRGTRLTPVTISENVKPGPGDTVIALVNPPPAKA